MSGAEFIKFASLVSFALLSLAFLLTIIRIVRGPTLPDRVLALDLLVGIGIAYIAVGAIFTGYFLYLDIAISLGLVGFLATVAFARFILHRGKSTKKYENNAGDIKDEGHSGGVGVSKKNQKGKTKSKPKAKITAIKKEKTARTSRTKQKTLASKKTSRVSKSRAKQETRISKKKAEKTS